MFDIIQAIILGITQGILEWLPVSSEGINSLIMINFFNISPENAIPISIFLHAGTSFAAIVYFRKDIRALIGNIPYYSTKKLSTYNSLTTFLLISTTITGFIGFFLMCYALNNPPSPIYSTIFIGALLVITGLIQRKSSLNRITRKDYPTISDAIFTGTLQGFSALPGMSRSGITLLALFRNGFSTKDALRLSFLMSIPVVAGAQIAMGFMGILDITLTSAIVSTLTSFIVGLLSIRYLMKIAQKIRFDVFCIYLGIFTILYAIVYLL